MKRIFHLIAVMATALCGLGAQAQTPVDTVEHEVLLETTKGNIRVKLFNATPRHRDHFMKLVREGYYNGLLFHRVIPDFMIQAGDRPAGMPHRASGLATRQNLTLCRPKFSTPRTFTAAGLWLRPARATTPIPQRPHHIRNSTL